MFFYTGLKLFILDKENFKLFICKINIKSVLKLTNLERLTDSLTVT